MLFNSYTFAIFLPLVWCLYLMLPQRGRQLLLLGASYLFYCWEHAIYGLLLAGSTVLDYVCCLGLEKFDRKSLRRLLLGCSLTGNLSMLGFFKYIDFFGSNIAGVGRLLGFEAQWSAFNFILPVGISFYTFQTMSYSIQVYRRQLHAERDFITLAVFVSFFPQLIAGPIERAVNLLPQLNVFQRVGLEDIKAGILRITFGLFKKLVLADRFAILVDLVFSQPESYSTLTVWVGVIAFTGQLYFDFAGYADIAIGSARLFGIRLMENFRRPILAHSMADFWNRWHISLTTWFRDYVFLPLGGFRKGKAFAMVNSSIVLLLCGLWHGAHWSFVLWGLYHAIALSIYYGWTFFKRSYFGKKKKKKNGFQLLPSIALTYLITNLGVVFFRSPDLDTVGSMFCALVGCHEGASLVSEWYVWVYVFMAAGWVVVEFLQDHFDLSNRLGRMPWPIKAFLFSLLVMIIMVGAVNNAVPYIYFQF